MYSSKPSHIFGFHGLDKKAAFDILNQKTDFIHSKNKYDWLGDGVYFWENNYERAIQYAKEDMLRPKSKIKEPFVLGAIIDLGNCLDLLDQKYLDFLQIAYQEMEEALKEEGKVMPTNGTFGDDDFDFKKRELDCAVIRYAHTLARDAGEEFDSVRAAFWEGEHLYPGAAFKQQNHIQVAILNQDCIKGVFLPRKKSKP
jgi:hypothetical protein